MESAGKALPSSNCSAPARRATPLPRIALSPEGFTGTLRPYEATAATLWLAFLGRFGPARCLADDMGLGKTIQTLALIQAQQARAVSVRPCSVCPLSVVENWLKEANRFTTRTARADPPRHQACRRATPSSKAAAGHGLVVSSYGLLHRDLRPVQGRRLGRGDTGRSPEHQERLDASVPGGPVGEEPVASHCPDWHSRREPRRRSVVAAGLPQSGPAGERKRAFANDFFIPIQLPQDADTAAHLKRLTGPFILRRLKTDPSIISDLPEKIGDEGSAATCRANRPPCTLPSSPN